MHPVRDERVGGVSPGKVVEVYGLPRVVQGASQAWYRLANEGGSGQRLPLGEINVRQRDSRESQVTVVGRGNRLHLTQSRQEESLCFRELATIGCAKSGSRPQQPRFAEREITLPGSVRRPGSCRTDSSLCGFVLDPGRPLTHAKLQPPGLVGASCLGEEANRSTKGHLHGASPFPSQRHTHRVRTGGEVDVVGSGFRTTTVDLLDGRTKDAPWRRVRCHALEDRCLLLGRCSDRSGCRHDCTRHGCGKEDNCHRSVHVSFSVVPVGAAPHITSGLL